MSGQNLFVYKNNKIAFSDYFMKNNGLLLKMPIEEMIAYSTKTLTIPLDSTAVTTKRLKENGGDMQSIRNGIPHSVQITSRRDVTYVNIVDNEIDFISHRVQPDSHGCRSTSWSLESTASMGCLIYDDVETIYEEAYRSCGMTPPPYWVGDIEKIATALRFMPLFIRGQFDKSMSIDLDTEKLLTNHAKASEYYRKNPDKIDEDIDYILSNYKMDSDLRRAIVATLILERRNDFSFSDSVEPQMSDSDLLRQSDVVLLKQQAKKKTVSVKKLRKKHK